MSDLGTGDSGIPVEHIVGDPDQQTDMPFCQEFVTDAAPYYGLRACARLDLPEAQAMKPTKKRKFKKEKPPPLDPPVDERYAVRARTFRLRLDKDQRRALCNWTGAARFTYNHALVAIVTTLPALDHLATQRFSEGWNVNCADFTSTRRGGASCPLEPSPATKLVLKMHMHVLHAYKN